MIDLINRILEEGRDNDDLGAILEMVSEQLVAWRIPVCRTTLNMPTIDPAVGVLSFQWSREKGVMRSTFAPGVSSGTQFRHSPIGYLVERNLSGERWKLEDPEVVGRFPLFQELRAHGITEYALQIVPFSKGRTGLQGAALSMATDRPGGFSDAEIEEAARILPALSLVAYRSACCTSPQRRWAPISVRRPGRACCRERSVAATARSFQPPCCSPISEASRRSSTALGARRSSAGSMSISNASAMRSPSATVRS